MYSKILDSFDTPGGHIILLTGLVFLGVSMTHFKVAKGEDVLIGSFAALLALLRGLKSNGDIHA